jgi:hypothetical protein
VKEVDLPDLQFWCIYQGSKLSISISMAEIRTFSLTNNEPFSRLDKAHMLDIRKAKEEGALTPHELRYPPEELLYPDRRRVKDVLLTFQEEALRLEQNGGLLEAYNLASKTGLIPQLSRERILCAGTAEADDTEASSVDLK